MKKVLLFIMLFSIFLSYVKAYDFIDENNKASVYADRQEIYLLKEMYDELSGNKDDDEEIEYIDVINSTSYWWPIGSVETTVVNGKEFAIGDPEDTTITSYFGYRDAVININGQKIAGNENHGALDIANTRGAGVTNVIAARSGVVVYPTLNKRIDYPNVQNCNPFMGYGNYVIIQHDDGNYTLYAHLSPNTITVREGDTVDQGQVIAKMGTSGCSTGPHLHFEVRLGENTSDARVDPLEYVDKDNSRPSSSSSGGDAVSLAREVIDHYEGIGCGPAYIDGDDYIACAGGDGVITIGHGVTVDFANTYEVMNNFRKYGYDSILVGTRVPVSVVDKIEDEILDNNFGNTIKNCLASAGIDDLKEYQIAALISRAYNGGPAWVCSNSSYPNFVDSYKKYNGKYSLDDMYSSKGSIWTDSMNVPIRSSGSIYRGLQRRRAGEWVWFTTGKIDYFCDDGCFNPSKFAW